MKPKHGRGCDCPECAGWKTVAIRGYVRTKLDALRGFRSPSDMIDKALDALAREGRDE